MKLNWGTGLVISLALFVVFILNFVIRIVTQDKYNHDLVTEDYYAKELILQREIDGAVNARTLSMNVSGQKTDDGYLLIFPKDLTPKDIQGMVSLYRPSNKNLDFEVPLELDKNELLIPGEKLISGRWDLSIFWEYEGQEYYFKKKLIF